MATTVDELGLTELVCSIDGLSAVGAAAILAETGDLTRFSHARAVVKHAGLAPRANASGAVHRQDPPLRRGRPRLRLAAWRAVLGRPTDTTRCSPPGYRHLTTRETNRLSPTQAQTALAAALLRWLHTVITHLRGLGPRRRRPRHQITGGGCRITRFVTNHVR